MGKILLVDDEPDFTELIQTMLSFHDFEADVFNDGREVEGALGNTTYDLVVTDLMMPNFDGFELVRMVRSKDAYKTTPIIVLSAKTLNDDERKTLLHSQVHVLSKPFEPQGLVDKIQELIA